MKNQSRPYIGMGKKGGDTYGCNRASHKRKSDDWGDKSSVERSRGERVEKERRKEKRDDDERDRKNEEYLTWALSQDHPQQCPVCLVRLQTHLVAPCGNSPGPFHHRGHGFCETCATHAVNRGRCHYCTLFVDSMYEVGVEFFAGN